MEYNQYWNEIKGPEEDIPQTEEKIQNEDVVSFSYGVTPEEPKEDFSQNIFDDEETSEEGEVDDSKMYSNSSLFELIDELEEKEETEEAEKIDESRFVSFEFSEDAVEEEEKDVHIFSDELEMVFDEVDNEDEIDIKDEVVEESVPHFECPTFDDNDEPKEETDIDKLIEEAKAQESSQKKLLDSELLPLLKEIIQFMPADCQFIDYVAALSNDDRKELVRVIEKCENAWEKDHLDKMFTIADGQLSICILSDASDPMREVQRLEAVGAQMFSYEKESWNFVKLYFVEGGKLLRADTELINKGSFNNWQWKVVQQTGFNLWKSRQ